MSETSGEKESFMSDPLKDLIAILKEGNIGILFWVCPKGCNGRVGWTEKDKPHPIATCEVCGMTNRPASPVQPSNLSASPNSSAEDGK